MCQTSYATPCNVNIIASEDFICENPTSNICNDDEIGGGSNDFIENYIQNSKYSNTIFIISEINKIYKLTAISSKNEVSILFKNYSQIR